MSFPNIHGQDLPPRGSYPEVQFRVFKCLRTCVNALAPSPREGLHCGDRFPGGWCYHGLGTSTFSTSDIRKTVKPIRSKGIVTDESELFRESQWARLHLIPLLEAESDR